MTLVLSGKTRTPARRGSCQCRWKRLAGGQGVCTPLQSAKLTHQSGKRSTSYRVTRRSDLGDRTNPANGHSGRASGPSPLDAVAERAFHAIRAFRFRSRESNRSGSRQYERRRVN